MEVGGKMLTESGSIQENREIRVAGLFFSSILLFFSSLSYCRSPLLVSLRHRHGLMTVFSSRATFAVVIFCPH